jgi:hypothetical protein
MTVSVRTLFTHGMLDEDWPSLGAALPFKPLLFIGLYSYGQTPGRGGGIVFIG